MFHGKLSFFSYNIKEFLLLFLFCPVSFTCPRFLSFSSTVPGRQGSIVKRAPAPPPPPQKGAPPVPPMWTGTAPLRTWTFFAEDSLKRYSTDCRSRNNFWKMNNSSVRCNQRERVKCLWSEICQAVREAGLGRPWDPVADVAFFVAPLLAQFLLVWLQLHQLIATSLGLPLYPLLVSSGVTRS